MPAVQAPANVLVTGASGFLGSHVSRELLEAGFDVCGTVRSDAKGQYLKNLFKPHGSHFSYVIVRDVGAAGAFDVVFKEHRFDAVVHVASPFHFTADSPEEIIDPAVKGTTSILESIQTFSPSVKRVVVTSSVAAIFDPTIKGRHTYTEADWNEESPKAVEAQGAKSSRSDWYCASKVLAEKAAWNIAKRDNVQFDLSVVNPGFIFGPTIHEVKSLAGLNESNMELFQAVTNPLPKEAALTHYGNSVDVRDVAKLHRLALETEEAGGQRFIASIGAFAWQQVSNVLREAGVPNIKPGWSDAEIDLSTFQPADGSKATKILGLTYIPFERMIVDTFTDIRTKFPDAEKREAKE